MTMFRARLRRLSTISAIGGILAAGGIMTAGSASAAVTPLTVAVSPAHGAQTIGVTANVLATFSLNVTGVDSTSFTLVDVAAGTSVVATVTYDSTTRVAKLDPTSNLAADKQFRATLTSAIRAGSENLVTTSWTFTTGPAPAAMYRWPLVESRGVEPWTIAQVSFNEAVTGVNSATFTITNNSTGAVVPGLVVGSSYDKVWRIYPTANLAEDTWYTVKAVGGASAIRDLAGNPFSTIQWRFLTGLAPMMSSRNVSTNAVGVPVSTTLDIGFTETIIGMSTTTFTLKVLATGAPVPATVNWSAATGKWVLTPSASLLPATQYRLQLTGGTTAIRDLVGNPFSTLAWNFTTA